jgi:hypothetical protein
MTDYSPFDLAPIPRRPKAPEYSEKPGAQTFRVEAPGEAPTIISLPAQLVSVLVKLAAAMPEGLTGGEPRVVAAVNQLRAAGVPISSIRAPRRRLPDLVSSPNEAIPQPRANPDKF